MSNSASSLPLHLTSDILLRLHAESVVRSRYVSKLWSSITSDPYFADTFATQSSTRPNLLMFFQKRGKLFVFSFPQHNEHSNESYSSHHVDSYHMNYPNSCFFAFSESVHGLICFRDHSTKPVIWNPSIRQFLTLPEPEESWEYITCFLGYDPIEGKHKVVCMPRVTDSDDECRVLTLGSAQESWRSIKPNHNHRIYSNSNGICINGVLYYDAYIDDPVDSGFLMSFDVRSENFDMIKFPSNNTDDGYEQQYNEWFFWGKLIPYEGKLACVSKTMDNYGIALWILEDAKKHEWSCTHLFPSFLHSEYRSLKTKWKLRGVTDAGEFIYVPSTILKSFYILYFDPKRNISRKVEFKEIASDGFRFSNRLGSKRLSALCIIPNHIESLMSLLQLK